VDYQRLPNLYHLHRQEQLNQMLWSFVHHFLGHHQMDLDVQHLQHQQQFDMK
jgi:hypothetical protein